MSRAVEEMMAWLFWALQCGRGLAWHGLDRVLGVRTTPPLRRHPHTYLSEALLTSRPCAWLPLYRVLGWLRPGPGETFLDVGCGHGRAVLAASRFPFRRVLGLELSPEVHAAACRNLAGFRLPRRAPAEIIQGDATRFAVPDDVTVLFMYNPFTGPVFEAAMARLFESLERRPRRVRLIYANPTEHDVLQATGRCQLVKRFHAWRPPGERARALAIYVYELDTAAQPRPAFTTLTHPEVVAAC